MLYILTLFLCLFISIKSYAAKCCFCEIGNLPVSQQSFFKMGCNMWLKTQKNCAMKAVVPQNTNYADMNLSCRNGEMSVGYVGHWESTYQTINYLQSSIFPAIKSHNLSVQVENTACRSMSAPDEVLKFIKNLALPTGKSLSVVGNQVLSVGKWDILLGSSINFIAGASSNKDSVQYPSCKSFQDRPCIQQVQQQETGVCIAGSKKLTQLTCCGVEEMSSGESSEMRLKFVWSEKGNCKKGY